jgi:uncharacterized membrane protein (Fun14 family)
MVGGGFLAGSQLSYATKKIVKLVTVIARFVKLLQLHPA